jgi:ubiquinone/menaquinone biosynthesis C-methylase UbiE
MEAPRPMSESLTERVRRYWEAEPCGTGDEIVGDLEPGSPEWSRRIEENRYRAEPYIHTFAQFTRHRGERVLEIGVGAGTDHMQWARAGANLYGVDLTDAAVEATRARLAMEGLTSNLQRVDAEQLPFADGWFDLVYSWGVIHHADRPELIIDEVRRVLRPGGQFIGMLYGRHSLLAYRMWIRHALRAGHPSTSLAQVISDHMESTGTKAYTADEVRQLFGSFASVDVTPVVTVYDLDKIPRPLHGVVPRRMGWFLAIRATR